MARELDARKRQLEKMTRVELLDIARKHGIKGRHSMAKSRIIDTIAELDAAAAQQTAPKQAPAETAKPKKEAGMPQAAEPVGMQKVEDEQAEVEQAKYTLGPTPPSEAFPLPAELPERYGKDMLTLLVRDPHWAYAYWEITDEAIQRAKSQLGSRFDSGSRILRVYDLANGKPERYFDIELDEFARNWYINLGKPGGKFCVEFGLRTPDGEFYPIIRSNDVAMPPVGMSDLKPANLLRKWRKCLKNALRNKYPRVQCFQ